MNFIIWANRKWNFYQVCYALYMAEQSIIHWFFVCMLFCYSGRGGVWEECVITSPNHTQIVGLSATLPNADALAGWMQSVTNRKTVLVEAGGLRPVPLRYLYASSDGLMPLFQNPDAGPGSPRGLLGFRGDGIAEASFIKKGKKRKGFSDKLAAENVGTAIGIDVLPRGLKVNQDIKKGEKEVCSHSKHRFL